MRKWLKINRAGRALYHRETLAEELLLLFLWCWAAEGLDCLLEDVCGGRKAPQRASPAQRKAVPPPTGVFTLHRCHNLKGSPLYRLSMKLTIPGLPKEPFGLSVKATTPPSPFLWTFEVAGNWICIFSQVLSCVFVFDVFLFKEAKISLGGCNLIVTQASLVKVLTLNSRQKPLE